MFSVKEALLVAVGELKGSSKIPQKEARILLAHYLKKDQIWLITNEDRELVDEGYFELIRRRKEFEPVEYITNSVVFYSEEFFVDSRVLIPRPETELLVDVSLSTCKGIKNPKIVEIGCGSGVVSIMLAKLLPTAKITALDISKDTLEVSKINAKKHGVEGRIEFILSDLLNSVENSSFDLLVSNPPYIKNSEVLEPNLSYEPDLALFGGKSGDEILKRIIDEFKSRDIKFLACEMGYNQREKILSYLENAEFYKDLAGFDRGFLARK